MGKESFWCAFFDDFAFVDKDDTSGDFFGEIDFVSDDDDGHAIIGELVDELQNIADGFWVEGGSGFVEKEDFGIHHHGANNGDALFLAAR